MELLATVFTTLRDWPTDVADPSLWLAKGWPLRPLLLCVPVYIYMLVIMRLLGFYESVEGGPVGMVRYWMKTRKGFWWVSIAITAYLLIVPLPHIITSDLYISDIPSAKDGFFQLLIGGLLGTVWIVIVGMLSIASLAVGSVLLPVGYFMLPFISVLFLITLPFFVWGLYAIFHYWLTPHPASRHVSRKRNILDPAAAARDTIVASKDVQPVYVHENMRKRAQALREELAELERKYGTQEQRAAQTRRVNEEAKLLEQMAKTTTAKAARRRK